MKIAVVSDSHDNIPAVEKFVEIVRKESLKYVFHLGDIISPFTLRKFSGFKYYGVYGNNDGEKLLLKKISDEMGFVLEEYPLTVELEGKDILLLHGSGSVDKTVRMAENFAKSGEYDFVFYGHTHKVQIKKIENTIIVNPGELCGYLYGRKTFAVVDLKTGEIIIREIP